MGFQIKHNNENIIVNKFIKNQFKYKYEVIRHLCSSNFVIKKNSTKFDVNLGVGSKFLSQSGEDTDYLLKNFTHKNFFFKKRHRNISSKAKS